MATQLNTPIVHVYKEVNNGKYLTTKHYELVNVLGGTKLLSHRLNLSKNRNFALSTPEYWLKERQGNKWAKYCLTGLFKTKNPKVFYGDTSKKKNLLLFKFDKSKNELKIYYFNNFYTKDLSLLKPYIK